MDMLVTLAIYCNPEDYMLKSGGKWAMVASDRNEARLVISMAVKTIPARSTGHCALCGSK